MPLSLIPSILYPEELTVDHAASVDIFESYKYSSNDKGTHSPQWSSTVLRVAKEKKKMKARGDMPEIWGMYVYKQGLGGKVLLKCCFIWKYSELATTIAKIESTNWLCNNVPTTASTMAVAILYTGTNLLQPAKDMLQVIIEQKGKKMEFRRKKI